MQQETQALDRGEKWCLRIAMWVGKTQKFWKRQICLCQARVLCGESELEPGTSWPEAGEPAQQATQESVTESVFRYRRKMGSTTLVPLIYTFYYFPVTVSFSSFFTPFHHWIGQGHCKYRSLDFLPLAWSTEKQILPAVVPELFLSDLISDMATCGPQHQYTAILHSEASYSSERPYYTLLLVVGLWTIIRPTKLLWPNCWVSASFLPLLCPINKASILLSCF